MVSSHLRVAHADRARARLRLTALALGTLLLYGCLPSTQIDIVVETLDFNAVPTVDRGGSMGRLGDARFGPYFDGLPNSAGAPLETIALLYPELDRSGHEALLKSDCYWSSTQESFTVSWETVLTVCRPSALLTSASPNTFGVCRLNHPVTGIPLQINNKDEPDVKGCLKLGSAMAVSFAPGEEPIKAGINVGTGRAVNLSVPTDLYTYAARFWRRPEATPDAFARCPGPQGFSGDRTPARLTSHCAPKEDLHSTCVGQCPLTAAEDGTYEVTVGPGSLVLNPTIRVVGPAGRVIAREMARAGDTFSWQTPVEGNECGVDVTQPVPSRREYRCRWQENFSPQVQVERVEIFALTATGQRMPVPPAGPLTVRSFDPISVDEDIWSCVFESGKPQTRIADPQSNCNKALVATPTFTLDAFNIAVGDVGVSGARPMTVPLRWSVPLGPNSVPANATVFIEFTLRARAGQALVVATPSRDLGRTRIGHSRGERLLVRNAGSEPARVDSISLTGAHAADFQFRPLQQIQEPLKAPMQVTVKGNHAHVKLDNVQSWEPLIDWTEGSATQRLRIADRDAVSWLQLMSAGKVTRLRSKTTPAVTPQTASSPIIAVNTANLAAVRRMPFNLAPGESVEIFVDMTPRAYGRRQALLRVKGVQSTRPDRTWQVYSSLQGWGLYGPDLRVFPAGTLQFPYPPRPDSPERSLFVDNAGDEEAIRTDVKIVGRDASKFKLVSQHAPRRHISPGDGEAFQLSLSQPCLPVGTKEPTVSGPVWQAALRITTSDKTFAVPLSGRPLECLKPSPRGDSARRVIQ